MYTLRGNKPTFQTQDKGATGYSSRDVLTGEAEMLRDVVDIAERALRDPANVGAKDIQKLAGAVVAHVRRV